MRSLVVALVVGLLALSAPTTQAQSIEGIWQIVEVEVQGGPNAGTYPAQGGLLVYGERHFAWVLDLNEEPRPPIESPTDAQMAANLQLFTAVSGTYELDGSTLRYHHRVNVNPAGTLPENLPQVRELTRLTSDRLETIATNADGVTTILRYRRVE